MYFPKPDSSYLRPILTLTKNCYDLHSSRWLPHDFFLKLVKRLSIGQSALKLDVFVTPGELKALI